MNLLFNDIIGPAAKEVVGAGVVGVIFWGSLYIVVLWAARGTKKSEKK